jgi:hypothetical protein
VLQKERQKCDRLVGKFKNRPGLVEPCWPSSGHHFNILEVKLGLHWTIYLN